MIFRSDQNKVRFGAKLLIASACLLLSAAPSSNLLAQERETGFYPTLGEAEMLGAESKMMYRRSAGGLNIGGPDASSLTASGLWAPDREPYDNFYERNSGFFDPLDSALGIFAPNELISIEGDGVTRDRLYGYGDLGFPFTRDFNPDLATFRLGPLFLDILSIGGTVLYSDFNGHPPVEDDGWLSVAQMNVRILAQLTENLFLTASGQIYYLPNTGDWGVYFADGDNSFARLGYETHFGDWHLTVYDEFRAYNPFSSIFYPLDEDAQDIAGRYRFGRYDSDYRGEYFSGDSMVFTNTLGAFLTGPLSDTIQSNFGFKHLDAWHSTDFDDHRTWDTLMARLDFFKDWWFAPYIGYTMHAVEDWDRLFHNIYAGGNGIITENLRMSAHAGYSFATGDSTGFESPIGDLTLHHNLGPNTTHSLSVGARQTITDYGDNYFAKYVRYAVRQALGPRSYLGAYGVFSNLDNLDDELGEADSIGAGVSLGTAITDYTHLRLDAVYDTWDQHGLRGDDRNRWIYRAVMTREFLPYLRGNLTYQFTDQNADFGSQYEEHLYMFSLNYLF